MSLLDNFPTFKFDISSLADDVKRMCLEGCAIKRRENFWTLGMSTYKDGYNNLDLEKVERSNDFLMSVFPHMYLSQLELLVHELDMPVKYMPGMPVPGFHVFKYCKEFEEPLARPHVDVPFNKYDWGKDIKHDDIFTHVVPVEIPENAGMNIWDLTAMDMHERGAEAVVAEARRSQPYGQIKYNIGEAVIHSGKIVHQIMPFEGPTEKWRITLQSHAVLKDGCWQLYW